jgi:hypothetical protein
MIDKIEQVMKDNAEQEKQQSVLHIGDEGQSRARIAANCPSYR